jgi:hypothetical protein
MSASEDEKALLVAVFRRRGENGRHMRIFDDLEPAQQEGLLGRNLLTKDELPILGSFSAPDRWFLLTSQKVAWSLGGVVTELPIEEIEDAIVDLRALQESGRQKTEMRELQLKTRRGLLVLESEPGPPLSGVWNVLKSIGVTNRGRKSKPCAEPE